MRELVIVIDDKTQAIGIRGNEAFTMVELLGIAEHLRLCVQANHSAQIQMAAAQALEKKIQVAQAIGVDKAWPRH
jgi:hypothetical protein